MFGLLKRPSAFLPLAMSATVLGLMFLHFGRFGTAPQADEGLEAHVFQILMPLQVPIVAFFAIKWLPRARTPALEVLAMQLAAAAVPIGIVFALHL